MSVFEANDLIINYNVKIINHVYIILMIIVTKYFAFIFFVSSLCTCTDLIKYLCENCSISCTK